MIGLHEHGMAAADFIQQNHRPTVNRLRRGGGREMEGGVSFVIKASTGVIGRKQIAREKQKEIVAACREATNNSVAVCAGGPVLRPPPPAEKRPARANLTAHCRNLDCR